MGRLGITYQDVRNAANRLVGQGEHPTIEKVRGILKTGSIGTINTHLRQWRSTQNETQLAHDTNLPEEFVSLMKGLWDQVLARGAEQAISIEKKYKDSVLELQQNLEKYQKNNQRWQQLHNQWLQEKQNYTDTHKKQQETIDKTTSEYTLLITKHESLLAQIQEKQDRIEELNQLHQQAQINLEHYREATREQRMAEQEHFAEIHQQSQNVMKQLQQEKAELHLRFEKEAHDKLLWKNQTEKQALELSQLHDALTLTQQVEISIKEKNTQLDNAVNNLQHSLNDIQQQLILAKDNVITMKEKNEALSQEKWHLANEKSHLEGQLRSLKQFAKLHEENDAVVSN